MARKERRSIDSMEMVIDLTPCIDMVFQMVMFFVVITDFTQKDIALLTLPWSTTGIDDEGEDEGRLIINITAPRLTTTEVKAGKENAFSKIQVKGKDYTYHELFEFLTLNGVKNPKWREKEPGKEKLSSRSVLIRCDGKQSFDYVKSILQICAHPDVAIYKIEIATAEKAPEPKGT